MINVLWFSRHELSADQESALITKLGPITVNQVNKTINHASEIKADIDAADVIAIVAPLPIQKQFLDLAGDKPVIMAKNLRTFTEDGKVNFVFNGWDRIVKIDVVTEPF